MKTIEFKLTEIQQEKFNKWNHKCDNDGGAIGGKLQFVFTPTGLGVILNVKCVCGEKLDLTEYEKW